MLTQITSAISSPTETASLLSSTISSKLNDNYPNLSRNISNNYSHLSNKVADNYNKLNENYPYITSTKSTITSTFSDGTTYLYSLPASIGCTVYSYTSMFQPVDGSEEREITRTPPNDNLNENVIPLTDERIELVNHILNLYSCKPSKECFKHYSDEVIFEDPVTYVTGLPNLKSYFYGLPKIFLKSTTENYKIMENTLYLLKINLNQKYTLPFVSRAVVKNSLIILEFNGDNENNKIIKHSDLWGSRQIGKEGVLRKGVAKLVSTFVKVPEN